MSSISFTVYLCYTRIMFFYCNTKTKRSWAGWPSTIIEKFVSATPPGVFFFTILTVQLLGVVG